MAIKNAIKEKYDLYKRAFKTDGASDLFPTAKNSVDLEKSNLRKWHAKNK